MNKYEPIARNIATRMGEARFSHTLAVANEAKALGKAFSLPECDCERLYLAGLFHDITKALSHEEQLSLAKQLMIPLSEEDAASYPTLHAITGAALTKREFPTIADGEIVAAIASHTTGKANMTLFEKLLYLADYIEPTRKQPVCRMRRESFYRELSESDDKLKTLNLHLLAIAEDTKRYVLQNNAFLHSKTDEIIMSLQKELNNI